MAHIIEGATVAEVDGLLANMFVARKRVFIDLLHWDVPVVNGRYEIDEFDGIDTVYLTWRGRLARILGPCDCCRRTDRIY